jgi:hypothetical protein
MTVGIDGTYAGNSAKGSILKQAELIYPENSTYNFDFSSIKESQSTFEVGVPLLFGADIYKGLYAMAGVRVGLPVMNSYSVNTDFTRWIQDGKGIDPYTELGNHKLFSDSKSDKGKMNLNMLNPQVAIEIGYNLDPYIASKAAIPAPQKSNGDKVVKLMENRKHACFPNLSFLALAVSTKSIYPLTVSIQLLRKSDAGSGRKALSERTGSLEDTGKRPSH